MNYEELFSEEKIEYKKINQGIFRKNFYFGKLIYKDGQKTEAIILSNKQILANLSKIKKVQNKKRVPEGEDELYQAGFITKGEMYELFPGWSNQGVKDFLAEKKVTGPELFEKIRKELEYYIDVIDEKILDLATVFIISTYCYSMFDSVAYLLFHSDKESGKSKFMKLIGLMAFNSINATNPSESAIFRICDNAQACLLIDDFEKNNSDKQEAILQIIKVGYKRPGQTIRVEKIGNQFEPREFDVYCPKIITNTSGLDSVTLTRCIVLRLVKTKTNKGRREPIENDSKWQLIRDECYIYILQNWEQIYKNYIEINSTKFNNRQFELVKGLLAIASNVGENIYTNIEDFLEQSFNDRDLQDVSGNWEYILFSSLYQNVDESNFYAVNVISEYCRDKIGIEKEATLVRWIGKTLSRNALFKKRRVGSGIEYFLSKHIIKDYMERAGYPIETTLTTLNTQDFKGQKVRVLEEPILDTCKICGEKTYVKYCSIEEAGRNFCEKCFNKEVNKLENYV